MDRSKLVGIQGDAQNPIVYTSYDKFLFMRTVGLGACPRLD